MSSSCISMAYAGVVRLQPVFVDLHLDDVVIGAVVAGPDVLLGEAHAVEHLRRLAVESVGELFRVGEGAADALDHALLAANVVGRASMARRERALHAHLVADRETVAGRRSIARACCGSASGHHRLPFCLSGDSISSGTSKRRRISAIRDWSSLSVMRPFS